MIEIKIGEEIFEYRGNVSTEKALEILTNFPVSGNQRNDETLNYWENFVYKHQGWVAVKNKSKRWGTVYIGMISVMDYRYIIEMSASGNRIYQIKG